MVAPAGAIPPPPPHQSPSTAQSLPPEVVDSIASHLVKASDMTSAACACRAWRGPFQRRVFQNVRFDSNQAAYAFLHCGSAQRHLVKELHLYAEGMGRDMVASAHHKIIGRMQGIGTLYASGLDLVLDDRMPDAFKDLLELVLFCEVKVRNGNGRAPFIFPRLERLSLMQLESFTFVPFRRGDRSSLARYMQTPVHRHLELGAYSDLNETRRAFFRQLSEIGRAHPSAHETETRQAFLQQLFAGNGARLVSISYANKCADTRMLEDMVSWLRSCTSLCIFRISLAEYESYQWALRGAALRGLAESLAPLPELQELDLTITHVECFRNPTADVEHLLSQDLFPKLNTLKLTIGLRYPRFVYDAHGEATDYVKEPPSAPVRFLPGAEGVSLADLCERKKIALNITAI
ncbi:BZ3500_MvSof-1268-A1-R1_Chr2-1g04118 [Microbotryum saponariae]|uniref:BZ3500_MvSof-1268-A1-R1_Chr2-1g04118 protein n=1 Tax=Microbotryum saponariae TaxID=289078 RepID=A0A2X0MHQ5_9BASI|nr:BZ3500_MvSof-1268-A1-R1_Chr2-1g04118 [Microbotryum saponariae]SCZ91105.1 BZ3501_MvSof-1269-A2-R1_Chr2-1g03774 [Microbotryum saponariae]